MTIDDMIPREKVLEAIVKLEDIADNQKAATDILGHDMYMKSWYAHSYMCKQFDIRYDDIKEYREAKENYQAIKQLELDFYKE